MSQSPNAECTVNTPNTRLLPDSFLADFPDELGAVEYYDESTGLYCIVGWAMHCLGFSDHALLQANGDLCTRLGELTDYGHRFWSALMTTNDCGPQGEDPRDRASRMLQVYGQQSLVYIAERRRQAYEAEKAELEGA